MGSSFGESFTKASWQEAVVQVAKSLAQPIYQINTSDELITHRTWPNAVNLLYFNYFILHVLMKFYSLRRKL